MIKHINYLYKLYKKDMKIWRTAKSIDKGKDICMWNSLILHVKGLTSFRIHVSMY